MLQYAGEVGVGPVEDGVGEVREQMWRTSPHFYIFPNVPLSPTLCACCPQGSPRRIRGYPQVIQLSGNQLLSNKLNIFLDLRIFIQSFLHFIAPMHNGSVISATHHLTYCRIRCSQLFPH